MFGISITCFQASKNLAIHQLNRYACIYIAIVMGESAENMAEYFLQLGK